MPKKKCPKCKGRSWIKTEKPVYGEEYGCEACPICLGLGYVWKKPTAKKMKKVAEIIRRNS